MKSFVITILFCLFAWVGIGAQHINETAATEAEEYVMQDRQHTERRVANSDAVVPIEKDRCTAEMEMDGMHNLAHRVSASAERMFRFSSLETSQFIKNLLRRMAIRMADLAQCHAHVYNTSRNFSCDTACEHYVFGMRRILI